MNMPLVLAAVCAGLPGCAVQDPAAPTSPDTAVFAAACSVQDNAQDSSQRASGALPARASTRPEPQLGTVAPSTRVPSHVVTPSMRAMERATAAREAQEATLRGTAKKISPACDPPSGLEPAPPESVRKG